MIPPIYMTNVIDITNTHGMGTARVIEQFGIPRSVRKFITDHVDWITTKVYFEENINQERLRTAVSKLIRDTAFLRSKHVVDGKRDLLFFENYDVEYNYLSHGTKMFKIICQTNSVILSTSHVISDLKSCYLIGKDLKRLYDDDVDSVKTPNDLIVYNRFVDIFANATDNSRTPCKWRFVSTRVERNEECFTKEAYILNEMEGDGVTEFEFEEIFNTARLFDTSVRGCTTIATLVHTVQRDHNASQIQNIKQIAVTMRENSRFENISPNTYTARHIYNFIKTDKIFNSILTHILLSTSEVPSFVYDMVGLFLPMKNDTTEYIKVVFQNEGFGSITFVLELR